MRKNLLFVIVMLTGLVISMTACILGEDVEMLERKALKENFGLIAINKAAIQSVTAICGKTPVKITETDQYTGTVTWLPNDTLFKLDTEYTATITLTAKKGYTLNTVNANFFIVAGATTTNSANSGVITAKFPKAKYVVDIAAIEGITVPVPGGIPKTIITDNDQYSGTVTWSPKVSETFALNTQYTATITLTAKSSYTLQQGVSANFFTVAGATTTTNSANSGVIKAVFPVTAPTTLIAGVWADGNISSGGEQWFKFTAYEKYENQYIHINFGTLSSLNVQVYNKNLQKVGDASYLSSYYGSYINRTLTSGQVYYIKVTVPSYNSSGTYRIAFNTSYSPPNSNAAITTLISNVWANGSVSSNSEQWFKFTATANTQFIHADFNTQTSLYVYVYDSSLGIVGDSLVLNSGNKYISRQVTKGQVYYIKVTTYSYSGTYQIAFTASATTPSNITLTAGIWTDGTVSATGEQWFEFTATASTQYIHASFNSLTSLFVQLYDSGGNTLGSQTNLSRSNRYISRQVTNGQEYYIRVTPYNSSGTYQITFNASSTPPSPTITLTANTWADGTVSSTSEQMFKFNATANTQYIHVSFRTLSSSSNGGLNVQVYNSSGSTLGSQTRLYGNNTYFYLSSATIGQTYYIKVTPYNSNTGTYQITFTTSDNPPLPNNINATTLTTNVWTNGTVSTDREWFKFTATASNTQYIHVAFGTLDSSSNGGMYVLMYNSGGSALGSQTRLYSNNPYTSLSVTSGQTYYIRVMPYSSSYSGTYQITFNTSSTPPLPSNSATATTLTASTWANGNLSSTGEQWFKFNATTTNTTYIHFTFGTLNNLYVQVYSSSGDIVVSWTRLYSNNPYTSLSVTSGQTYYIRVMPYSSSYSGTYQITFNTSSTPPLPSNSATATTLTASTWANGNLSSTGEQWFKFDATSSRYVHIAFGTLNSSYGLYVQVYDPTGWTMVNQARINNSNLYTNVAFDAPNGLTIYIKVTPYSSSYTGTYQIAFNTSSTAPSL